MVGAPIRHSRLRGNPLLKALRNPIQKGSTGLRVRRLDEAYEGRHLHYGGDVRLGREICESEVRVQVEASHDGEFVVVDVATGGREADECECHGDDVAVLAIEVGEEPGGAMAPPGSRPLYSLRNSLLRSYPEGEIAIGSPSKDRGRH